MQAEEIVEGDTLHLTAGDVVPADATISTISTLGGVGGALLIGAGNRSNNVRNNKSKRGRVSKGGVGTVIWTHTRPSFTPARQTCSVIACVVLPTAARGCLGTHSFTPSPLIPPLHMFVLACAKRLPGHQLIASLLRPTAH